MRHLSSYHLFESEARPVITYDFDGVMHTGVIPGTIHPLPMPSQWTPNMTMINRLKDEAKTHDIYIVTARDGDSSGRNQWIDKFVIDHKLPVKDVICTNDTPKLPYLKKLGSIRHYDDNKKMIAELRDSDIEFVLVDPLSEKTKLKII